MKLLIQAVISTEATPYIFWPLRSECWNYEHIPSNTKPYDSKLFWGTIG